MKLGIVISLLVNLALVAVVGLQARKVNQARQEIAQINEELPKAIKGMGQVAFIAGCLTAYADTSGSSGSDNPLWPIIQDACMKGSVDFADTIKFSETK